MLKVQREAGLQYRNEAAAQGAQGTAFREAFCRERARAWEISRFSFTPTLHLYALAAAAYTLTQTPHAHRRTCFVRSTSTEFGRIPKTTFQKAPHTNIHAYMHTCIHTYLYAYIHTHTHTYVYTHTNACMHACMHTYTYTYIRLYFPEVTPENEETGRSEGRTDGAWATVRPIIFPAFRTSLHEPLKPLKPFLNALPVM